MDADWSVELGHDDPALEFPWSSEDGARSFVDLSSDLADLDNIPEARQYRELAAFLAVVNAETSTWITAKCDAWFDRELGEAEQIYDAKMKMCSYIDLIRRNREQRFSFELHEHFVKQATIALGKTSAAPMACEFIVRRCWYQSENAPQNDPDPGFYITVYVFGYGSDGPQARTSWSEALTRIASVIAPPQG